MVTKDGKKIKSCIMTDDTWKYGNCASCMYWKQTGPFGEGYCRDGNSLEAVESELGWLAQKSGTGK